MKKILILVSKVGSKKEVFVREIESRLGDDTEIHLAKLSDLYFEISDEKVLVEIEGKPLTDYDLVYIRRAGTSFSVVASTLAVFLTKLGVKFIDTTWGKMGALGSKFTSLARLGIVGLPISPTVYMWADNINVYSDRIPKVLGFPFVAKELSTQRGSGVYRINSEEDLRKLPMKDQLGGSNQYMFQKFINIDHEYRLLVLGTGVRVWEEKVLADENEFRHNVALGASERFLEIEKIPHDISSFAVKAANTLDFQIAGVDIATEKGTGKIFLIEVNRGPGLTYDTSVSPEIDEIAKFLGSEADK